MARYFLEVKYKGSRYAGFQLQQNAVTIQGEIDRALAVLLKTAVKTTGSSRTDAGVHARQNFLHFDTDRPLPSHLRYKLNGILDPDIAVQAIYETDGGAHARFSALSRAYLYRVYTAKDPFLRDSGYYFPYTLDESLLEQTAAMVRENVDFKSFSKRNTQVKTFDCRITRAAWEKQQGQYIFRVQANRFLRGMVRGLVGTMLKTARGKISPEDFLAIIASRDNKRTDFSAPPQGLFLTEVCYPEGMLSCRRGE